MANDNQQRQNIPPAPLPIFGPPEQLPPKPRNSIPEKKSPFEQFTTFMFGSALWLGFAVFEAWVAMTLWNWFLPAFFGLTKISLLKSIVLMIVGQAFLGRAVVDLSDLGIDKFKSKLIAKNLAKTWFCLTIGFICKIILFGF